MTARAKRALTALSEGMMRLPYVSRNRVLFGSARIGTRLTACFILIVLSMMAADVVAVWQFRRITAEGRRLARADQTSLSVVRTHFDVDAFRDKSAALIATHDIRQFTAEAASLSQKFVENVAQSREMLRAWNVSGRDPSIESALETLRTTLPSQLDTTVELALAGDWPAVDLRLKNQVQALIDLSALLVRKVDREVSQEREQAIESGNQARKQLVVVLPVAALLTLLVAVALGWYATRSISNPLSELEAGAKALAEGNFRHKVSIRGHDELAQLGQVFNDTARQLEALYETLRGKEALLRLTIDTIPAYVWSALPDGSIDFINQRWLQFSGMSLEQAIGWGWEAAVYPEDRDHFLEAWRAAVASGKAMEMEARIRRADGQYRWLLIRNVPLRDETGKIVKWYGTSSDIDDRKQMEETLRRSEAYLAEAQRLSHTGSWAFDAASNMYIYASEECLRIFDLDAQQDLPTREVISRRIHPEDWDRVNRDFEKSLREKIDTKSEFRVLLSRGTVKHIQVIRHPVLNNEGDVAKLVGTVIDVTERKRAEEALRRSEAYLADAQRLTHTGAFACDPTTEPLYWSEELFRIFGFDPQRGLPTRDQPPQRIHPEDLDEFWQAFRRAIDGKVDSDVEYRIVLPDGTVKHVYGLAHPVLNSKGELVEVVGTTMDITERKRAEEQRERLRQVEADLAHIQRVSIMGELVASIAHEVNQPLSGITSNGSACVRWLAGDPPNLEEAREAARRIVRDGKRAAEVIARIRALAKRAVTSREKVDLNGTIREVLTLVADEAEKQRVTIRTQFADDLSPVSGDRVQLQQVVLNLVMNGIEAMGSVAERARELVITTQNTYEGQVRVTVQDSGAGLDPNAMEKIFDPFYTTKPGGMGMGLSVCRSIIQSHGGRAWATTNDGPGIALHFSLPQHQEEGFHAEV